MLKVLVTHIHVLLRKQMMTSYAKMSDVISYNKTSVPHAIYEHCLGVDH